LSRTTSLRSATHRWSRSLGLGPADLGVLLAGVAWGVGFVVVKGAIGVLHPVVFSAIRTALAGLALVVCALAFGVDLRVSRREFWELAALGVLGNSVGQLLFILGLARTTAENAALVNSASPVLVAVIGTLLGLERVTRLGWLGVLACFGGIALVVTGGGSGVAFAATTVSGDLLVLLGNCVWSAYTLICVRLTARHGAIKVTVYTLSLAAIPQIFLALPLAGSQPWAQVGWSVVGAILFAGLVGVAIGQTLWNLGIKHLGATRTAVYSIVPPLVTALLAWLVWGIGWSPVQWVGAVLALGGVTLARLRSAPRTRQAETEQPISAED
jgi:drug/metabolite transporter (DMT)-like permease